MLAFIEKGLEPAYVLLPPAMRSREATAMILAICLQESRFLHRRQIGGPARGYAQFERGGGVAGVLRHYATGEIAEEVCAARGVAPEPGPVHAALEHDDVLAAAFARLLLWTDPAPLPKYPDGPDAAWRYYLRNWRPGKPHRETWDDLWERAWGVAHAR